MGQPKKRIQTDELRHRVLDEVRFLKNWLDKPLVTGAVAPSSPALARLMASHVDPAVPGLVVELGPGTGVVTQALLDRGIAAERIAAIEYNPDFCTLLRQRFPGVHFVHGDAYRMRPSLGDLITGADEPVAAVISSLPLFTRPLAERVRLLDECLELMPAGAPFIQFSYALVPPVPHGAGRFEIERTGWVVMNLPPARVWIYRRP
jgi:phosphatidylethanolamine/phosphatidyl-N-methylethanolamine N-methyltransferase